MPDVKPYSKFGHLAIGAESTPGTVVKPSIFLELLNENLKADYNIVDATTIAGSPERRQRSVKDKIEIAGEITVLVDARNIGYWLAGMFGSPSTKTIESGNNATYQHTFEPSTSPKTYTIEIRPADADFVYRYVGCRITKLSLSQVDNKYQAVIGIMGQKVFTNARVTEQKTSGTSLPVDQTTGLLTTDRIIIKDKDDPSTNVAEKTISAIPSENEITLGSALAVTASVNDIAVIKRQTPSYTLSSIMIWRGGTQHMSGDDIDNTSEDDAEDFTLDIDNEFEPRWKSGKDQEARSPEAILQKSFGAQGSFMQYFKNPGNIDKLRSNAKVALRVRTYGDRLSTNSAQVANFLLGSGTSGVLMSASTAGEAGNDLNITVTQNNSDNLVAVKTGNNITLKRAKRNHYQEPSYAGGYCAYCAFRNQCGHCRYWGGAGSSSHEV